MKYFVGLLGLIFAAVMTHGQWQPPQDAPAYHAAPPAKRASLPPILTPAQIAKDGMTAPAQKAAYKAAAKVGSVFYQQPCYCHCDKTYGHASLRSCFEGTHGGECGTCMAEALYTYQKTKKGWTPKMIRDGIMRRAFETMDLKNPPPVM